MMGRATDKPHGADLYVLRAIAESLFGGVSSISYTWIAGRSGYSKPTVQAAIERLARAGYITVLRGGPSVANTYTITASGWRFLRVNTEERHYDYATTPAT